MSPIMTPIDRAPCKWRWLFTLKYRKTFDWEAGGMAGQHCRCGAATDRDSRAILCRDGEGGASQRQKAWRFTWRLLAWRLLERGALAVLGDALTRRSFAV